MYYKYTLSKTLICEFLGVGIKLEAFENCGLSVSSLLWAILKIVEKIQENRTRSISGSLEEKASLPYKIELPQILLIFFITMAEFTGPWLPPFLLKFSIFHTKTEIYFYLTTIKQPKWLNIGDYLRQVHIINFYLADAIIYQVPFYKISHVILKDGQLP